MARAVTHEPLAIIEISPRTAKILIASTAPVQVQRVNASLLPEAMEEPVAALRALLNSQALGTRQVGILLGRQACSLRTLELPSTDPKEIASMLELQLGKLTPYPRTEILSAWTTIGSFREGYTSVLLAMTRKTLLDGILQLLKAKGVEPAWVGLSTEGLEAWWASVSATQPPAPEGLTALIDVDAHATDCAVLSGAKLVFTHSIAIGAQQLATSEQAKLRWVGELVRLPRILQHEDIRGQMVRGVLTGLTEQLPDVVEQLTSQWGVSVEMLDALKPCAPSPSLSQSARKTGVSYAALIGVALRQQPPRLDLIPQETRVLQALDVRSKHLARVSGSVAAILLLAAMGYLERMLLLQYHLTQLEQRLVSVTHASSHILELQAAMQRIREWIAPARGP